MKIQQETLRGMAGVLWIAGIAAFCAGGTATAGERLPSVRVVERAGTNGFRVAQGRVPVIFAIRAETASAYGGMELKRIRLTSTDDTELTTGFPSVTVDLLEGARLSSSTVLVPAEILPGTIKGREATVDLYLRNETGKVLKLSRRKAFSSDGTEGGIVRIDLPQTDGDSSDWTAKAHMIDVADYRRKALDLIRRAGAPSLQVVMTTPLDRLSFCVVNEAFYAVPGRQQEVRPIDGTSMYQACSISKVPLSYFAVKMAQDGQLDLDRPLSAYNPDILRHFDAEQDQERAKRITARHVLTHTSGLPNAGYRKMTFKGEPGEQYIYSGPGMYLLQETLEHLKGLSLDLFSKKELFDHLGMAHSNYLWQDEFEQSAVYGFRTETTNRNNNWKGGRCNAAYSLRTNAEEFSKFLQWFLRGADLKPAWRRQMFTPSVKIPPSGNAKDGRLSVRNLGWVATEDDEFGTIHFHGGNNVSYKGLALMIPERHVTLCYFLNGDYRYNLHGPLTDLFLNPRERLAPFRGGIPLPENAQPGSRRSEIARDAGK